jgi:hypothetical protein
LVGEVPSRLLDHAFLHRPLQNEQLGVLSQRTPAGAPEGRSGDLLGVLHRCQRAEIDKRMTGAS